MTSFVHPALFYLGLPIIGVPILIHLINMMRHRRVEWAAMEFLLVSQRKNRTWVILKQLLLLLMRMGVVAAVVLMIAQPKLRNRFGQWFGGVQTHHIILLDDSFSMAERWADTSAFSQAKKVVERIGAAAARETEVNSFTLIRFSRVARQERGTEPDLLKEPVDKTQFPGTLDKLLGELTVSELALGPAPALEAIGQLLGDPADERRIVYLISDFRTRQWDNPTDLTRRLAELNEAEAEVHLINCSSGERPNLAITRLAAPPGIRAAGVPFFVDVTVHNYGDAPARNVAVLLEEDGHARAPVTIAEVPPGQATTERFMAHFPDDGEHRLVARLKSDSVAADNARFSVVPVPLDVPVLLVDGGLESWDARFLSIAMAPGGPIRTGLRPQIETPRYLTLNPLEPFSAVCLTNFDRLDASAVEALEAYVSGGGGVAFFVGEQTDGRFVNDELFREGEGLFPVPLSAPLPLTIDRLEKAPDLQIEPHPIFRVLSGKRNSFLPTVLVEKYFGVPESWEPGPDSTVQVIGRLRNGAPLVVERRFGEGRVVAFLTTAAPEWNNWARNPSFVVAMQDLQAYLAQQPEEGEARLVGSRLQFQLDPEQYQPQVRFLTPTQGPSPAATPPGVAPGQSGGGLYEARLTEKGQLEVSLAETSLSGIYEAQLSRLDGTTDQRAFALNVDPEEGNLEALGGPQLAARLQGIDYVYEQSGSFQYDVGEAEHGNLWRYVLYALVVLLILEQLLAWSASYHPSTAAVPAVAKGGAR
jgi:hypothetical protein